VARRLTGLAAAEITARIVGRAAELHRLDSLLVEEQAEACSRAARHPDTPTPRKPQVTTWTLFSSRTVPVDPVAVQSAEDLSGVGMVECFVQLQRPHPGAPGCGEVAGRLIGVA